MMSLHFFGVSSCNYTTVIALSHRCNPRGTHHFASEKQTTARCYISGKSFEGMKHVEAMHVNNRRVHCRISQVHEISTLFDKVGRLAKR